MGSKSKLTYCKTEGGCLVSFGLHRPKDSRAERLKAEFTEKIDKITMWAGLSVGAVLAVVYFVKILINGRM